MKMIIIEIIILAAAIGIGYSYVTRTNDSPLEEIAEVVIERELESLLDLPDGDLNGKIDLSPNSKDSQP